MLKQTFEGPDGIFYVRVFIDTSKKLAIEVIHNDEDALFYPVPGLIDGQIVVVLNNE